MLVKITKHSTLSGLSPKLLSYLTAWLCVAWNCKTVQWRGYTVWRDKLMICLIEPSVLTFFAYLLLQNDAMKIAKAHLDAILKEASKDTKKKDAKKDRDSKDVKVCLSSNLSHSLTRSLLYLHPLLPYLFFRSYPISSLVLILSLICYPLCSLSI